MIDVDIIQQPPGGLAVIQGDGSILLRHSGEPPAVVRRRITDLVQWMLACPGPHEEMVYDHSFCDGMYIRKMFIPKGQLVAGKVHLADCLNFVESGDITVLTEFGALRAKAGFMGASRAGIQKVVYTHEDTVFVNVFRTDETDVEVIEALVSATEHAPEQLLMVPQGD